MTRPSLLAVGAAAYVLAAVGVAVHAHRHDRNAFLWFVACFGAPFTAFVVYAYWHVAGEPTYQQSADAAATETETETEAATNATEPNSDVAERDTPARERDA